MKIFAIHLTALLACFLMDDVCGKGLPSYMTACNRHDPELNDCALKQARASARLFARGDKTTGYPQLDPLKADEIRTAAFGSGRDDGIKLVFRNVTIVGLADLDMKKMTIDIPTLRFIAKAIVNLTLDSFYELSGRLLLFPLTGKGKAHVVFHNVKFTYVLDHKIVNKDGVEYLDVTSDNLKNEIGKAEFHLENLFNGDKALGDATNALLNSNWREVVAEMAPPVVDYIRKKFKESAEYLHQQVPYDELLLP